MTLRGIASIVIFLLSAGMENPTLTFITPTLICGDKSLTDVVAHEIAHSWTGNLVTNATSNHFWLNEGFTVSALACFRHRVGVCGLHTVYCLQWVPC